MDNSSSISSRLGNIIKGGVAAVAAGVLALSLSAGIATPQAYATSITSNYYDLPKATEATDFVHHDSTGNYDFRYLTVGSSGTARVAPKAQTYYEVLGLNYTYAYRGPAEIYSDVASKTLNTTYMQGNVGSLSTRNATLAIILSCENPDEYIMNYCCWANGATQVQDDQRATEDANGAGLGALSIKVGDNAYADFPREVYMECDVINAENGTANYASTATTYDAFVKAENSRTNRPKGTSEYDPVFFAHETTHGGGHTMSKGLYELAKKFDTIIADNAATNGGKYTLRTRFGGTSATGTFDTVSKYEDLVQGVQYYTLKNIQSGSIAKAVTATLVGYDPVTGNYACRVYGTDKDPEGNQYGGRVANYLASISSSITELGLEPAQDAYSADESKYVVWYTPEQIMANCDAAFVCDAPSANKISTYLATASDGEAHCVYYVGSTSYEPEDMSQGLVAAGDAVTKAGGAAARLCLAYPCNMFDNMYAQGCENGMLSFITAAITYPTLYKGNELADMFGFWARYVWHTKSDLATIQKLVTGTTAPMSSSGGNIGTIDSNYETVVQGIIDEGNKFYVQNADALDALNGGNLKTYDIDALIARTSGVSSSDKNSSGDISKVIAAPEKMQTITTSSDAYTATVGDKAFNARVRAWASTEVTSSLKYASDNDKVATAANGYVTIVGVGTANITITAPATEGYKETTKVITVTVNKKSRTIETSVSSPVNGTYGTLKTVDLGAKLSAGEGALTYTPSNKSLISVSNGVATIKGAGTSTVSIKANATDEYEATSKTITFKVSKAAQPMTVKAPSKARVVTKISTAKRTVKSSITVSKKQGSVTYSVVKANKSKSKFSINNKGVITVKKGTAAGTYTLTVRVKAAGNSNYASGYKDVKVKVRVS